MKPKTLNGVLIVLGVVGLIYIVHSECPACQQRWNSFLAQLRGEQGDEYGTDNT